MTARTAMNRAFRGVLSRKRTKRTGTRRPVTALAVMLTGLLLAQAASAKVVYRWINDAGRPEVSHSIPPDAVHRGYDILDGNSGRLISKVPPQMTDQEYQDQLKREQARAQCDRTLRRLYTLYEDLGDIDEAELSALRKLDVRVENARQDLLGVRKRLENFEAAAARRERQGEKVLEATLEEITKANNQIATLERELTAREREREEMQLDYQRERLMFENNRCDVTVIADAD